jgi:glycerol-1-phosphate dehydrogenase [NAD(P)+]
MDPHLIELPQRILVGRGVSKRTGGMCKALGLSGTPLILSGPSTTGLAGNSIADEFSNSGGSPVLVEVRESTLKEVERVKEAGKGAGFIIAVGGGKVIDVAKMAAFEMKAPYITVPTAPSHDGIASERASLSSDTGKHSIRSKPPVAIVADIEILSKAPYRLIAAGCADIISNCSSVNDWRLAREKGEYYSDYAADLALLSAEVIMRSARSIKEKNERGIRNLVEALISSSISMSLAGSSRPASGAEHMFSHALEGLGSKALHGEQCGVGCIIMSYLQDRGWKMVKDSLKEVGAPTTAKELGVTEEMVIEALLKAKDVRKRYTILDVRPMTRELAIEACKATGVFE